ncbi:MAG: hypothetical protein JSR57_04275 [Verrucomicrobia bacterium]|nr:hypothetical protein [Verrucomicrobiota bacterium]
MNFFSKGLFALSILIGVHGSSYSIEVQGHRGARGLFPENTLPAFAAAIEAGTHTLELDLHVTKDGEVIIHHDYFVDDWLDEGDQTSKMPQMLIRDLRLVELKKIDCGNKINIDFPKQQRIPGTSIPTLDELFEMISRSSSPHAKTVRLNLEVKRDPRYPELTINARELAAKIVAKVHSAGFSQRVYYSSFDPEILSELHSLDPEAELGFIFNADSMALVKRLSPDNPMNLLIYLASSFNATVISPEHALLTDQKTVNAMQNAGFRVVPWTVNSEEEWGKCIEMGVDGLITDYPQDLLSYLNKQKAHQSLKSSPK